MSESNLWWQQASARDLADTLKHIKSSRTRQEPIDRCFDLCNALNKTFNSFFTYRRRTQQLNEKEIQDGRSDARSLKELLLRGLTAQQTFDLCHKESVRCLATLTPHVMNHDVLLRDEYDPDNISEKLHKKASEIHREMLNAWDRYCQKGEDEELRKALLRKLADLLLIVRSNIAHGEKSLGGLDSDKGDRDRLVCLTTSPAIEDFFDLLLDRPSQRLAVYGTLAPGQPNESQLQGLDGKWTNGTVEGDIEKRNGPPIFRWRVGGNCNAIQVFSSAQLSEHFGRLDRFEGKTYRRILVPISSDGTTLVANIYEAHAWD